MAKGFKHGVGGSPLNFKVVAYDTEEDLKAATPKENIVGVVTKNKITSWSFSFDVPSEPVEGMVWFAMGFNSIAVFNTLKKNTINVYPIYAQQYISGAWVDVSAMVCQGGDWAKCVAGLVLYSNGDEHEDITGGFVTYTTGRGAVTKGSGNIYLTIDTNDYLGVTTYSVVHTSKKIDLTHYRTLRVKYSCRDNSLNGKKIFVSDSSPLSIIAENSISTATTEVTLDISGLSGEHYVGVGMMPNQGNNAYAHLYVNEINLER